MLNVEPKFLTFAQLLEKRLFRIPQYQRAYSWRSKERQDMFNDIRQLKQKPGASHFMATVVGLGRDIVEIGTDEYKFIDIVDGQQRLTTLVILLKVIEQKLDKLVLDEEIGEEMGLALAGVDRDADRGSLTPAARERDALQDLLIKQDAVTEILLQTNHDNSHYFENFLRDGTSPRDSEAQTLADQELLRAIHECKSFVLRWRDTLELLRLLKNKLYFIFHETHDVEAVYTVFEVLNDRGLAVSWLVKLKSRLMETVFEANQGNRTEQLDKLHRIWGDFYGIVGLRGGVDTEALTFAATLRSSKVSKVFGEGTSVDRLRKEVGTDVAKAIEISNWLLKVVQAVNKLHEEKRQAVTKIRHSRLLAVAIMLREFTEEEEKKLLDQWEKTSFLIFGLCRKDARTGVGDFVRLASEVHNNSGLSSDDIAERIRRLGADYTSDDISNSVFNRDCYTTWKEELRYLLCRYEEHLAAERGQSFSNEQWNRIWEESAANSIEHILPQSKGTQFEWGSGIFVHRLGNLLLLPPGLNSELGDKDPKAKMDAYQRTGLLIAGDVAETIQKDEWDEGEIENRENEILAWIFSEYDVS